MTQLAERVVYTALFGEHEHLNEQPVQAQSKLRFLCFTDDEKLTSESWEICYVPPLFPADPRLSQRDIKLRGHPSLQDFKEWLYIDNTVVLRVPPEKILDDWLAGFDWGAIRQPRKSVWEEFEKNFELSKDVPEKLNEQLNDYSVFHAAALEEVPLWNAIFARRNNEKVRNFTNLWFLHVCRYSSRDQLSQTIAMATHKIQVNEIQANARASEWHSWPHRNGETESSKLHRRARPDSLKDMSTRLAIATSALESALSRVEQLENRQWFGLRGLWRQIQTIRRKARRFLRRSFRSTPP